MQIQISKKKLSEVHTKVHNTIKDFIKANLLDLPELAIACSGGLDSMVLLTVFAALYPKNKLHVLHCDHAWHSSSADIADWLKNYSEELGMNFHMQRFSFEDDEKTENAAREKRYQYFSKICNEKEIKDLLLAHQLDDQVETVLFRIFRGTSSYGLQGIPEQRLLSDAEQKGEIKIHRPFLGIERQEIAAYAEQNELEFKEDPSNSSLEYSRNRIRHEILPEAKKINPNILNNVNRLSKIVAEEQDFIEMHYQLSLAYLGRLPFELKAFRKIHRVLQRKILAEFFTSNIDFCNQFLDAISEGGFHRINFSKGKFFTIKQKKIHLELDGQF